VADERESHNPDESAETDEEIVSSARNASFFADRPSLRRGLDPYERVGIASDQANRLPDQMPARLPDRYPAPYAAPPSQDSDGRRYSSQSSRQSLGQPLTQAPADSPTKRRWFSWLWPSTRAPQIPPQIPPQTPDLPPDYVGRPNSTYAESPYSEDALPTGPPILNVPAPDVRRPQFWEKQPYSAGLHLLALGGAATTAWFFGILIAQILPGNFTQPPLQETLLRRSSRVAAQLWYFPQLWRSPTAETRIEAIPLPQTGPVLTRLDLPPIERQPLIDELNAIETEILTLDRRLQTLEQQLGSPPYQGTGIDSRVNALRAAIDPPVRPAAAPKYEPTPQDPKDSLLAVVKLKITLPSDALFAPGQSDLKDSALLNQVLDQLVNYPNSTVLIRSYSDNQAPAKASRDYTLAQADVLSRYLAAALPGEYRWVMLGGGQSQPVASNDDMIERQRNRRIEILVDTR
jgi:flagellar motor protein MotB